MLDTDIAWAAGFFDGEGCITLAKHYSHHRTNRTQTKVITVFTNQIDPRPLMRMQSILGGSLYLNKHAPSSGTKRAISFWKCTSKKAEHALTLMLPYLVGKREQALLALEAQQLISNRPHRPKTVEDKQMIDDIDETLHKLKKLSFEDWITV